MPWLGYWHSLAIDYWLSLAIGLNIGLGWLGFDSVSLVCLVRFAWLGLTLLGLTLLGYYCLTCSLQPAWSLPYLLRLPICLTCFCFKLAWPLPYYLLRLACLIFAIPLLFSFVSALLWLAFGLAFCLGLSLSASHISLSHLQVTLRAQRLMAAGGPVHPQVVHETNRTLLRLLELRLRRLLHLPLLLLLPPRPDTTGSQSSNSNLPERRRRRRDAPRQYNRRIETYSPAAAVAPAAAPTACITGSVSPRVAGSNDAIHDPAAHNTVFPGTCFVQPVSFICLEIDRQNRSGWASVVNRKKCGQAMNTAVATYLVPGIIYSK